MKRFFIFLIFSVLLFACNEKKQPIKEGLASVGNVHLYQEHLLSEIPDGLSSEDSLDFVEQYIQNWIKEQVVLQKAEEVLPQESKDVSRRLEKYRKSLLIYTYEQAYIQDRLDTAITNLEIETYYQKNKKDFTLKGFIVKGYYASFTDSLDLTNVDEWYLLKKEEDYINLQSFSQLNAEDYYLDTVNWIYFDNVLEKIPLEGSIHKTSFVKRKKKIKFEDNGLVYYLNIVDSKLEDELSPLEFEREKIKSIIINKRTQKLRKELIENLYNDAVKQKEVKIYNKG